MILQAQLHVFHESMGHSILPRNMVTEHVLYFGRYSAMVFLEAEMSWNVFIFASACLSKNSCIKTEAGANADFFFVVIERIE